MLFKLAVVIALIIIILYVNRQSHDQFTNPIPVVQTFGDFHDPDRFTIALIGGVHGNEPSGSVALQELIDDGWFTRESRERINFIVIPRANEYGLQKGIRETGDIWHPDLNRSFHERSASPLSKYLLDVIEPADFVMDFHEGWGWHQINKASIGSTISPTAGLSIRVANAATAAVNDDISDPYKKFLMLPDISCDIKSALSCYMEQRGRNYILTETTGQKDIQPMQTRVNQVKKIVYTAVREIKME